jgi:hypothetical protein
MEASVVYQYGSYFYLFTSWDKCCSGTSSTYNIRVGRASSEAGPYVDQAGVSLLSSGGTEILGTHDGIYGPGGQDILTDSDGPILVYHYYESTGSYVRSLSDVRGAGRLTRIYSSGSTNSTSLRAGHRLFESGCAVFASGRVATGLYIAQWIGLIWQSRLEGVGPTHHQGSAPRQMSDPRRHP